MTISTKIVGMEVACVRNVKASKSDIHGTEVAWTFDFSDAPQHKILELATRSLVIDAQREFRMAPHAERKSLIIKRFLVADMLTKKRAKKLPTVKSVLSLLGQLSPEDQEILMNEHAKS